MSAAPGSRLAQARAAFDAKQVAAEPIYVDIWTDGTLAAQIQAPQDSASTRPVLRTLTGLVVDDERFTISEESSADVIAATTVNLGGRTDDGGFEAFANEPMRFDAALAAALGWPAGLSPRDMVLFAFNQGSPPTLNVLGLMACAQNVAMSLSGEQQRVQEDARAAVGEA